MSKEYNDYYLSDSEFDDNYDFLNENDVDILIREEAKQRAQKYLSQSKNINSISNSNIDNSFFASKNNNNSYENDILSKIEKQLNKFDEEINNLKFNNQIKSNEGFLHDKVGEKNSTILEIKKTLDENNNNLVKSFEKISSDISNALSSVLLTKESNEKSNFASKDENDLLEKFEKLNFDDFNSNLENEIEDINCDNDNVDLFDFEVDINKSEKYGDENANNVYNDFLSDSHVSSSNNNEDKIVLLNELKEKQASLYDSQNKISTEIDFIKNSINDFILNTNDANKSIIEQTIENTQILSQEVIDVKKQYLTIEEEMNKIYDTWVENNKLLNNLELLLNELNNKNSDLDVEKNEFNEEIYNRTVDNEKIINDLFSESNNLKSEIEKINERLSVIEDISSTYNNSSNLQDVENINNELQITQSTVNELVEKINSMSNENRVDVEQVKAISLEVVENELSKRNLYNPDEIMTKSRIIDEIMESDIFSYSLEKMINQVILDTKITENDKMDIVNSVISSEKMKNVINAEIGYVSNDIKLDLNDRFTRLRDDFNNFDIDINNKIVSLETKVDSNENDLQKHEIVEMIFSSKDLEGIIENKMLYVLSDKLNELKESMGLIESKIIENIKKYLDNDLEHNIKRDIIESKEIRQKIKNDALNAIYSEIEERDKEFSTQRKEMLTNYEALIENNRILENIETLIIRQVEEVEGFNKDKDKAFDAIVQKISAQKSEINYLKDRIIEIAGKDVLNLSDKVYKNTQRDHEVYENVKNLTSNLVKDEIKKLNLINTENDDKFLNSSDTKKNSSQFFKERIQNILEKLHSNSNEENLMENNLPLTNELRIDLDDLKINIDELQEYDNQNYAEDDDFDFNFEDNNIRLKKYDDKIKKDEITQNFNENLNDEKIEVMESKNDSESDENEKKIESNLENIDLSYLDEDLDNNSDDKSELSYIFEE